MWLPAVFLAAFTAWHKLPAAQDGFQVTEVAPGVFVHQGRFETMSRENLGDTANIGFIIGDECVAVIDTGGSPQVGAALKDAVESRAEQPVCYVINTHAHPDHVFGNRPLKAHQPVFITHENFSEFLGARMQIYLERFSSIYGSKLSPRVIVPPDRTVSATATLNLGNRVLQLTALGPGHTNNDLVILDPRTATLWAGDTVFSRHIPVLDGSIKGWLAVMARLQKIKAKRVVPGHGPVSLRWPNGLEPQRRYLAGVAEGVRSVIDQQGTIERAIDTVGYQAREQWLLFDEYHRRNVTAAFAELEWE